jgi:16S rRNA (adenine1518-N6/adenine1519-N6)-dimethyltransferase
VIRAAFQQRRKTLRKVLRPLLDEWGLDREDLERAFSAAGIDPQIRGERLSLDHFAALTEELIREV